MLLKKLHLWIILTALVAAIGCGREVPTQAPDLGLAPLPVLPVADKDGTETLGPPSLELASGSGLSHGGVSLVCASSAELTVTVPAGATVRQVLVYWAGGTTAAAGDDDICLDGIPVTGQLIGGPTWFYRFLLCDYRFSAYRADITDLGLVGPGTSTVTVSGFDFASFLLDENDGASIVVVWEDGSGASYQLRDGLDMAYFGYQGSLNTTVPQVFAVTPAPVDRTGKLLLMAASVGEGRPTRVIVTSSAGEQVFDNVLGATAGRQWDSLELPVRIPAGVASLSVQVVSSPSCLPRGAAFGWVGAALTEPAAGTVNPFEISGTVYIDADRDGSQDATELGLPGVVVDLVAPGAAPLTAETDAAGRYAFAVPAGAYTVEVDPAGHPGAFNADLAQSFSPTGPLMRPVTVGPDAPGNDFGFVPEFANLLADLQEGVITTDGLTQAMWSQIFRCAILAEQAQGLDLDGVDDALSREPVYGDDCGQVGGRLFYDTTTLRELLGMVSGLFLPEPFQFREGYEVEQANKLLAMVPRTDEEALVQELLVTELNYVTGRGTVGQLDLMASLASWAESLLYVEDVLPLKGADKSRADDLRNALQILEAVNTGGGGGVDE